MIDLTDVLKTLAAERRIFHSEADFQHAFAWEIHRRLPDSSIRLERPVYANSKKLNLDLLIQGHGSQMAIELKFKTRALKTVISEEEFKLKNQGAQDIGRYDFIKDIERLESVTQTLTNCTGTAILLTNDSAYWKSRARTGTVDEEFCLTEGLDLRGAMNWKEHAGEGTTKNREKALRLTRAYRLTWQDFSQIDVVANRQFRYLMVHVPRN